MYIPRRCLKDVDGIIHAIVPPSNYGQSQYVTECGHLMRAKEYLTNGETPTCLLCLAR